MRIHLCTFKSFAYVMCHYKEMTVHSNVVLL